MSRALRVTCRAVGVCLTLVAAVGVPAVAAQSAPPKAASLSIVVIEGEDAVNIIQQKTAVAPVVEVRDRNNQPVAGAVVQFAIKGGRATFNGARTLTVATNAAGRAAVTGLTPTSSGAFQIGATAAFQGQTAAVTIAQVNVLTAAEAAGAAGGAAPFDLGSAPVTGTPGNLTFTLNLTTGSGGGTVFDIMVVTGALANDVFTGTVAYRGGFDSAVQQNRGAVTFPITLR